MRVAVVPDCPLERFVRIETGVLAAGPLEATLIVAELTGNALLCGRFQRGPAGVLRRAGGGRTVRAGAGTLGLLLYVPASGGLLPQPVPADKVINRYVRGLLRGLAFAGTPAHYFGRDFVTADHRQIARVSQDGTPDGGVLLEAIIAIQQRLAPDDTPSTDPRRDPPHVALADLTARTRRFDELADQLALGFAATFQQQRTAAEPPPEAEPPAAPPPVGQLHPAIAIPIGTLQGETAGADIITAARLHGDFIATSFAIRALEASLAGCPRDPAAIATRVDAALLAPHAALLGADLAAVAAAFLSPDPRG